MSTQDRNTAIGAGVVAVGGAAMDSRFGFDRSLHGLEAVLRSLKSELGLRLVFHHKEERPDGHALHVRKAAPPSSPMASFHTVWVANRRFAT